MKRYPPSSCLLLPASCLLLLVSCAPRPLAMTREPVVMRLVSADSCGPLAEAFAAAYAETRPWVTAEVELLDSAEAEEVLRAGESDVALLSWLEPVAGKAPLWARPFARDGLAIIVHPTLPFTATGLGPLHEIFRGRMQDWDGTLLAPVSREDGSGSRAAFDRTVLGVQKVTYMAVVMPSSRAVIEYVGSTPGTIGYVSTLWLHDPAAARVRVVPVDGVLPTQAAVYDGTYPLARTLYVATVQEPDGEAREFIQWVLGPQGQGIVEKFVGGGYDAREDSRGVSALGTDDTPTCPGPSSGTLLAVHHHLRRTG